jgi:glycosyltransferase involved in cell wall biosynthesis
MNKLPPPIVGVVIPSFNYASKVGRAIESVKAQTINNLRCVIVDDGSTDNTREMVEQAIAGDPRFHYIHQENGGVATARNRGVFSEEIEHPKYVCCLDADDALAPQFLEACVSYLEDRPEIAIAYTGLWFIKPNGEEGLSPWPSESDYNMQLQGRNQIPTCNVARIEMWERLGGQRQRYAPEGAGEEDAELWLRAGAYGFQAKKVTDAGLFLYSWQSGRVSGNKAHRMTDYRDWHPWTKDGNHPFMSAASPEKFSHPVRQYDQPVISVIIPVGPGHESKLIDALDSLDAQIFRQWEAIVVWDNAADPGIILRTFPYITMISLHEKGGGITAKGAGFARNVGVRYALGRLIFFLDADDFLLPGALETFLVAWERTGSIVYSNYVAKSTITPDFAEEARQNGRLLEYDPKSGRAVLAYDSADYVCERAVRQPEYPVYHWCTVSMLLPKTWHEAIGGFDDSMKSWEDWDYQIRLAKAGYCYEHIAERLLVYDFDTGARRQTGIDDPSNLVKYMQEKYKEIQTMGCGCSGKATTGPSAAQMMANALSSHPQALNEGVLSMEDKNFVPVRYNHPNVGGHRVIGPVSGIDYGYRGGGSEFLVHVRDVAANPTLFVRIEVAPPTPPEPPKAIEIDQIAPPISLEEAKAEARSVQVTAKELDDAMVEFSKIPREAVETVTPRQSPPPRKSRPRANRKKAS